MCLGCFDGLRLFGLPRYPDISQWKKEISLRAEDIPLPVLVTVLNMSLFVHIQENNVQSNVNLCHQILQCFFLKTMFKV